jgi:hypothetical protein
MLFFLSGVLHFLLEIILGLLVGVVLPLPAFDLVLLVDFLVHFGDFFLQFDHQFVELLGHVEEDPLALDLGIGEYLVQFYFGLL